MIRDTSFFVFDFFSFRWVRVRLRRSTVQQYYAHALYTIPFLSRHVDAQFTDGEELYRFEEEARKSYCGCNKVETNTLATPLVLSYVSPANLPRHPGSYGQ